MIAHISLALLSGVVIETLYALGVIFISERRAGVSSALSFFWGLAFLVGVNESFKSSIAAVCWCAGLATGTYLGVWLKRPETTERFAVRLAKVPRAVREWLDAI